MSSDHRCCPTDAGPAHCAYEPTGEGMYMAGPLDAKAGVVLVSDIFGMLPNSKRFADDLGKAGFLAVMPDFFGERAYEEANFPPKSYEDPEWLAFFNYIRDLSIHSPRCQHAVDLLHKLGCKKVGIVGMCWGALLSVEFSAAQKVDAMASPHPSFLTPEAVSRLKTPCCLLPSRDETGQEEVKKAFDALTVSPKIYKHYTTLAHGFLGARFDFDNAPKDQKDTQAEAEATIINFFKETLEH